MYDISETKFVESIWEQFNKPLKSFIRRRVKSDQDEEDILQNTYYKIYKNINKLKNTDKVNAWIFRIARNSIVDFYRTQKYESNTTELPEEIISETRDEVTANKEIAFCLKFMIQYLPEKYKQAIILKEIQNLTHKELGERLGLSVSGAKSRVQRARKILKKMIIGCCNLEFDRLGNIIDYKQQGNDCKYC